MLRDGFLQQNAMSEVDATCPLEKQAGMLELLLEFYDHAGDALAKKVYFDKILAVSEREALLRLRDVPTEEFEKNRADLHASMQTSFDTLVKEEGGVL